MRHGAARRRPLPVAFSNFRRAYTLANIGGTGGMRITVDEVTAPGFTKLYVRKRVGGIPTNNDSVKFLRTTIA